MINSNLGKSPRILKRNFWSAYPSFKTGRIIKVLNVPKDFKSGYALQKALHLVTFLIAIICSGILMNSCHLFSKKNIEVEIKFFQAECSVNIVVNNFKQFSDSDLVLNIDRDNLFLNSETINKSETKINLLSGTYKFSLSFNNPDDKPEIIYLNRVDTVEFIVRDCSGQKVKIVEPPRTDADHQTQRWTITVNAISPNQPINYTIDNRLPQYSNIFEIDGKNAGYHKVLVTDNRGTKDSSDIYLEQILLVNAQLGQAIPATGPTLQEIEASLSRLRLARISGTDNTDDLRRFSQYFEGSARISWSINDVERNYNDLIDAISADTLNLRVVDGSVSYSHDNRISRIVFRIIN